MPTDLGYTNAYPRAGDVALLCEGDVVGYEVSLLRRWTDQKLKGNPLVDVWPCGTATSIFGTSDAIGRARPIMVIEDRDFRVDAEAATDCASFKDDRERRDVRILAWRSWKRNEIENYLLEFDIVVDAMAEAFDCRSEDVQDGLSQIIPTQSVYQAAQYAFYRVRRLWNRSDPSRVLPSNVRFRPTWDDDAGLPAAASRASIRQSLEVNLARWQSEFSDGSSVPQGRDLLGDFESKCDEWEMVDLASHIWRVDWAGKDILQWLRIWMTSRYGWRDSSSGERVRYTWTGLTRKRLEEQDRPIEAALRPILVRNFLNHLDHLTEGELYREWAEIETALRSRTA